MVETAPAPAPAPSSPSISFFLRHQFLILRLHSLSGLLPVGLYMVVHLVTNASVLAGAASYQSAVDKIHSLGPILWLVEWTFIFLPIIFHAAVGVMIIRSGISNSSSYPYRSNIRYTLQRATAWIALFFIFYHVFQMHGWIHAGWWRAAIHNYGGLFNHYLATSSTAEALASVPVRIVYLIGILSCVYHLANGLWTMGITWGVWTTPAAQRWASYVCGVFGILLACVGVGALVGMATTDEMTALATERVSIQSQLSELEQIKAQGGKEVDHHIETLKKALAVVEARQKDVEARQKNPPAGAQAAVESR